MKSVASDVVSLIEVASVDVGFVLVDVKMRGDGVFSGNDDDGE